MEKKNETSALDKEVEKLDRRQTRTQDQVRRLQKSISDQARMVRALSEETEELKQKVSRRDDYIQKLLNRSLWDRIRNVMP